MSYTRQNALYLPSLFRVSWRQKDWLTTAPPTTVGFYLRIAMHSTSRGGISDQVGGITSDYHPIPDAVFTQHTHHEKASFTMAPVDLSSAWLGAVFNCSWAWVRCPGVARGDFPWMKPTAGGFLAGVFLVSQRPVWWCRIPQALPGYLNSLCMSNQTELPGETRSVSSLVLSRKCSLTDAILPELCQQGTHANTLL